MKFFVYTKTAFTCSYHMVEAKNLDEVVSSLRADGFRWQIGKVFGHRRVALHNMPHTDAVMIAGNDSSFIAVEDGRKATNAAYESGEAYWVMH
jgi:hypothetical protein